MNLSYTPSNIFLVGGSVRDFLVKEKINDYDFVLKTNETQFFQEAQNFLKKNFKKNGFIIGKEFPPTVRAVLDNGDVVDITLMQGDFKEDALRRDFTINSIFMDLNSYKIIDPLNGVKDLENKKIRLSSEDSFIGDPLRLLRAIRLMGQLHHFKLEKETYLSLMLNKALIKEVSIERVREEIEKIFLFNNRFFLFKYLQKSALLFEIFPELKLIENLSQHEIHKFDVLNHSLNILRYIPENITEFEKQIYGYVSILHDLGKYNSFHGHTEFSVKYAEKITKRLKLPKRKSKLIVNIVANHMGILNISRNKPKENTLKKFVYEHYKILDYLIEFSKMETFTKKKSHENIFEICRRLEYLKKDFLEKKDRIDSMVNGKDLLEAGIHGEKIGKLLSKVKFIIYRDNVSTRKDALKILNSII